jgi:hypothetical protein
MTLSQENAAIVARATDKGSIIVLENDGGFQAFMSADEAISLYVSLGNAIRELKPHMCYDDYPLGDGKGITRLEEFQRTVLLR